MSFFGRDHVELPDQILKRMVSSGKNCRKTLFQSLMDLCKGFAFIIETIFAIIESRPVEALLVAIFSPPLNEFIGFFKDSVHRRDY